MQVKTTRAGRAHTTVVFGICFERQSREACDSTEKGRGRRQPRIRACGTFSPEDTQWPCAHGPAATLPCPPAPQSLPAGTAEPPRAPCSVATAAVSARTLCAAALACCILPPHPVLTEVQWVLKGPSQRLCTQAVASHVRDPGRRRPDLLPD